MSKRTGRPMKADRKAVRTKWISVRVSEQEHQFISETAKKLRIPSAQLLRERGLNIKLKKANSEININTYRQIAGIAKNINQLAAKINSGVIPEVDMSHIDYLQQQISEIAKKVLG